MDDLTKLDKEVAEALGWGLHVTGDSRFWYEGDFALHREEEFHPSTDGAQAMELLKQFRVDIGPHNSGWLAYANLDQGEGCVGTTPEIAICRAVVAAHKVGSDEFK